jgi:membrane-associated protease RseP (regulator of RpoE activity)
LLGDAARGMLRGVTQQNSALHDDLRQMVMRVFMIERENFPGDDIDSSDPSIRQQMLTAPNGRITAIFEGRLLLESEAAYDQLDQAFKSIDHVPLFREEKGKQIIYAVRGRIVVTPRKPWVNIVLFLLTLVSVLWVGAEIAVSQLVDANPALREPLTENFLLELWRGFPYALSILLILGAHELGHYFAGRRHKLAVTLPYFIPAPPFLIPTNLGTFGAFIQLREPMKNRKVLFDVGAAGPFMGLIFAIPILLIGLATSPVKTLEPGFYTLEGNSLVYALAKTVIFGRFLPGGGEDVFLNQLAWAGWTGLLVTALNLIPVGQLDGGHILYSLIGDTARRLYYPLMGVVLLLTLRSQSWFFWLIMLLIFGRLYATPLDNITRLDPRRRLWGILAIVVFLVTFVPEPLSIVSVPEAELRETALMFPFALGLLALWTTRRLRMRPRISR